MKKTVMIITLALYVMTVFSQTKYCKPEVLQKAISQMDSNAVFLKDFQVKLPKKDINEKKPLAKFSMVLNDSTIYQFSIANSGEYPGKAVFELYDNDRLIGSTYNEKKNMAYDSFTFQCRKSAVYHMYIWFIEGKEGCAVGVISYIGKYL